MIKTEKSERKERIPPHPLLDEWRLYCAAIVPNNAPDVQVEECRRAFYAGAVAMFDQVMAATEPESEDVCEERLDALMKEARAIVNDLRIVNR